MKAVLGSKLLVRQGFGENASSLSYLDRLYGVDQSLFL